MKVVDSIESLMKHACDKAWEGVLEGQTPFGAVIARPVDGGFEVVADVHNCVFADCDITCHAEVNAIRKACKSLGRVKLGECIIVSTCEPCPMCFSAIHWAGIKKIFFGASIVDAQDGGFSELTISNETMKDLGGSPVEIEGGVLENVCKDLFRRWSELVDKKTY